MNPFFTRNSIYFLIVFMVLQAAYLVSGIFVALRQLGNAIRTDLNYDPFVLWAGYRIPYMLAFVVFCFVQLVSLVFGAVGRRLRILWVFRIYMAMLWLGLPYFGALFVLLSSTTMRLPFRFIGPDCYYYLSQDGNITLLEHISCRWNGNESLAIAAAFDILNCSTTACNNTDLFPLAPMEEVLAHEDQAELLRTNVVVLYVVLGCLLPLFIYSPLIYLTHSFARQLASQSTTIQFQLETAPYAGNEPTKRLTLVEGDTVYLETHNQLATSGQREDLLLKKLGMEG